jgi:hypothetical protein
MSAERELPLRIVVVRPPRGVAFAVQRGRDGLLAPSEASGDDALAFDFTVRVADRGGAVNVLGPFAQGTPADRFIYVNSGTMAGQPDSPWTRRAKVKTRSIGWALAGAALAAPGFVLEARIEGAAGDGGPCCATVPLLGGGWTLRRG